MHHILFIHSFVDWYLFCFHLLAVVNSEYCYAIVSTVCKYLLQISFSVLLMVACFSVGFFQFKLPEVLFVLGVGCYFPSLELGNFLDIISSHNLSVPFSPSFSGTSIMCNLVYFVMFQKFLRIFSLVFHSFSFRSSHVVISKDLSSH